MEQYADRLTERSREFYRNGGIEQPKEKIRNQLLFVEGLLEEMKAEKPKRPYRRYLELKRIMKRAIKHYRKVLRD